MFQHILVPLDGSPRAERAIPIAARIARATGGTVELLQVVRYAVGEPIAIGPESPVASDFIPPAFVKPEPPAPIESTPPASTGMGITPAQLFFETEREKSRSYLASIARIDSLREVKTLCTVILGVPAEIICEYAQRRNINLIVLCSHGYTGFKRWALDSVAQKVAWHSPIPVLLLRQDDPKPMELLADKAHPIHALVAVDDSFSVPVLTPAAQLISDLTKPDAEGTLHVAHILGSSIPELERSFGQDTIDVRRRVLDFERTYLEAVGHNYARPFSLKVTSSVLEDEDIAGALIDMAELGAGRTAGEHCDLIAIATHGRSGTQRWTMGSITARILVGSKLPVLIVRPQKVQSNSTQGTSLEEVAMWAIMAGVLPEDERAIRAIMAGVPLDAIPSRIGGRTRETNLIEEQEPEVIEGEVAEKNGFTTNFDTAGEPPNPPLQCWTK